MCIRDRDINGKSKEKQCTQLDFYEICTGHAWIISRFGDCCLAAAVQMCIRDRVGRLGCFGFMIINIPGTWFGWWSDEAFVLYLIVDII